MSAQKSGREAVEYLIERGRLESIAAVDADATSSAILDRAIRRIRTASLAWELGDLDGAFSAAYDAYRMAAESLLARHALRATSGEGSHVTVEDAVSAQFADQIPSLGKPIFERFRRKRHTAQYFDPAAPEITPDDVAWAVETAENATRATTELIDIDPPPVFTPG